MHSLRSITAILILLLAGLPAHAAVILHNEKWSVTLEPETLAIAARPDNGKTVELSSGVVPRAVDDLQAGSDHAMWNWDKGDYTISARLEGNDLSLSIAAKGPGSLELLKQPAAAWGKGLIFPLAEGAYIPAGDKAWEKFLLERQAEFTTSQDISLPLWGLDHESFSLSWLVTNPFNNTARFMRDGDGLALSLEHDFTALDFTTPMTMLLHLGKADPLAGAKRYRKWLIAEGKYETLAQKIAATPEAGKLIGATHTYLWGSGLIAPNDVTDWTRFLAILKGDSHLGTDLRRRFDSEALATLQEIKGKPYPYQQLVLIRAFNEGMDAAARTSWQTAAPDVKVLTHRYGDLRNEVAATFPNALKSDPTLWGGGVSISTMNTLRDSGIQRLWIGLGVNKVTVRKFNQSLGWIS